MNIQSRLDQLEKEFGTVGGLNKKQFTKWFLMMATERTGYPSDYTAEDWEWYWQISAAMGIGSEH